MCRRARHTLQRIHGAVVQVTAADDAAVDQVIQLPLRAAPAAWGQALATDSCALPLTDPHCKLLAPPREHGTYFPRTKATSFHQHQILAHANYTNLWLKTH